MFKLNNITKTYKDANSSIDAIKNINIEFDSKGLYFILGPSGSGKSTLLNILGGLDTPTSGEMSIAGVNTNNFDDKQWDEYRNHHLGFVFQSFNLLPHLSILENVELKLKSVNKYSANEIREKSISMLDKVGLIEHIYKKPTQLSGGQQRRVAIARALVSNPKVLLCDEPTGALDNNTSHEVMELIKEIAKDTLIIIVTHDIKLTSQYDSTIIEVNRGKIKDTKSNDKTYELNKSNSQISYLNSLKLSFKNISTSIKRSLIVILACALSVTTVLAIFSLSFGLEHELIDNGVEKLANYPVTVTAEVYLTEDQLQYLSNIDDSLYDYKAYSLQSYIYTINSSYNYSARKVSLLPNNYTDLDSQYNLLAGTLDIGTNELVLILDKNNQLGNTTDYFGTLEEGLQAEDYIGKEIRRKHFDDCYEWNGIIMESKYDKECYDNAEVLKIGAVLSPKDLYPANDFIQISNVLSNGVYMRQDKYESIVEESLQSEFAYYQYQYPDININTGTPWVWGSYESMRLMSNRSMEPMFFSVSYVPSNSESKQILLDYISEILDDTLNLSDPSSETVEFTQASIDILLLVVIVISFISVGVAAVLIFILTYANILQRTKEIGILRSVGINKSKSVMIFVQETLIISITSTLIALILYLVIRTPINNIAYENFGYSNIIMVVPTNLLLLSIVCNLVFLLSSFIPVRKGVSIDIAKIVR